VANAQNRNTVAKMDSACDVGIGVIFDVYLSAFEGMAIWKPENHSSAQ